MGTSDFWALGTMGVGVPVHQGSVPKEREPIFKSMFIDVFEIIESSHTFIIFSRKFFMGSGF